MTLDITSRIKQKSSPGERGSTKKMLTYADLLSAFLTETDPAEQLELEWQISRRKENDVKLSA